MKRVAIVVVLVIAAAVLGLWRTNGGIRNGLSRAVGAASEQQQGEAREEIRKSFDLQPGARVEVQGINGKVTIETYGSDGNSVSARDARVPSTAEVYVLRTAGSHDALSRREVTVEQTANGFIVKGRQVSHGFWEHLFGTKANEEVTIKAPHAIALALKGINGPVTSGDIEGALEVKGINGHVELGQANESAEISGVNGSISVGLNKLGNWGVRVSGINGNLELRLGDSVNADLRANGMNGRVRSDIPEVNVDSDGYGSRYSARIGSGGAPITISGINGNVRLTRAESAATLPSSSKKEFSAEPKTSKNLR